MSRVLCVRTKAPCRRVLGASSTAQVLRLSQGAAIKGTTGKFHGQMISVGTLQLDEPLPHPSVSLPHSHDTWGLSSQAWHGYPVFMPSSARLASGTTLRQQPFLGLAERYASPDRMPPGLSVQCPGGDDDIGRLSGCWRAGCLDASGCGLCGHHAGGELGQHIQPNHRDE